MVLITVKHQTIVCTCIIAVDVYFSLYESQLGEHNNLFVWVYNVLSFTCNQTGVLAERQKRCFDFRFLGCCGFLIHSAALWSITSLPASCLAQLGQLSLNCAENGPKSEQCVSFVIFQSLTRACELHYKILPSYMIHSAWESVIISDSFLGC